MRYLYSLPGSLTLFLILIGLLTIFTQIAYVSFSILVKPNKKKPLISHIFNISLLLHALIICGVVASVKRHVTEGIIVFDYYLTNIFLWRITQVQGISRVWRCRGCRLFLLRRRGWGRSGWRWWLCFGLWTSPGRWLLMSQRRIRHPGWWVHRL